MVDERHEKRYRASKAAKDTMEKELGELDARISRLRVLYDQYFMGIEKMEPSHLRSTVEKQFRISKIPLHGNTVLKFRYRSLQQRFTSYRSYWDRIIRLIEDGKIRRGVQIHGTYKLPDERAAEDAERAAERERQGPQESLRSRRGKFRRKQAGDLADAVAQAAGQLKEKAPPSDYAPKEVDSLYNRLVAEKKRVGEATDKISRGVVEKSVSAILAKVPKDKEVRFRIVEKDGKVNLTAVLKKKAEE